MPEIGGFIRKLHLSEQSAVRLLKPIVRLFLRNGIGFQGIVEIVKRALVEAASEEVLKTSPKINPSRVSLLSGLHRKDVRRLLTNERPKEIERGGVIAKILSRWTHDPQFCARNGRPRTLSVGGPDSEFAQLVLLENTDFNPGTVLFELERTGAVERTRFGVKLIEETYSSPMNIDEGWAMLAHDTELLIESVAGNLAEPEVLRNSHLRTEYDNIFLSDVAEIRTWLATETKVFHKRVREYLSDRDRDLSPRADISVAGVKVSLGSFSLIQLPNESSAILSPEESGLES